MRRLLLTLTLILSTNLFAAEPAEDIDRFIARAMREFPDVPSLGVAVVRDGKTFLARGYGFRDIEKKLPATGDTVYYIASSTKSYFGLLTSILAARGVVDLDAPITKYIAEMKYPEGLDGNRVTLRALLSHTAGIDNDAIVDRTAFTGEHTPAMLIGMVGRSRAIEQGKYKYDNIGYVIASLVLERVTGRKWQDLLEAEIFAPLKMTRTTAYISKTRDWPRATPYTFDDDFRPLRMPMLKTDMTMHAAGGLVSTPKDLARWLTANIDRTSFPAAAFDEAQKKQVPYERTWYRFKTDGYALGWNHAEYEGEKMLYHFGGFEGWRAHVSFLPEKRIGVAVVTNTGGPSAQLRDVVASYIYDRLLGKTPDYDVHLAKLKSDREQSIERVRADIARRRDRKPSLTREPATYTGRYVSQDYGTLNIAKADGHLRASLGQLNGVLEPFTEPDTARVELIPGSGEVLRFEIDEQGRAAAVQYRDSRFTRQ